MRPIDATHVNLPIERYFMLEVPFCIHY